VPLVTLRRMSSAKRMVSAYANGVREIVDKNK
jgi:hypothetical protein